MDTGPWIKEIFRLTALLAAGLILSLLYGRWELWLLAAVTAYTAWFLINAGRFESWSRAPDRRPVPAVGGYWGEVIARFYRLRQRHRRRKRQIRNLLREFRQSTAELPDGAVILSKDFEILWFNAAAERLADLRRPEDIHQRIDNLIRDPEFVAYLNSGQFDEPITVSSPLDGGMYLSCQIVTYGEGQHLLLIKDVTLQRHLEQTRRDFVANASHELRSPLTVIIGYLDSLMEGSDLPADFEEPLQEMHHQADRMHAILTDLLALSRLEASVEVQDLHEVDIAGVVAAVRREALAREGVTHTLEVEVEPGARILGNEREINSAVSNLVSNAQKFTARDGQITISWSEDAGGGYLSVADTGIGIAAEEIPRLTERFYRADSGRAREKGGTGLGLAIVKHVLLRHGGSLEIDSTLGRGSRFTCHFPADIVIRSTPPHGVSQN